MRIIFVRHGYPDYEKDCLTEIGHMQAEAVAERLRDEKIHRICASSCGRAVQTAEHIAKVHGAEIEQFDFMREILWGSVDGSPIPHNGHPWDISDEMVAKGQSVMRDDWESDEYFCNNKTVYQVRTIGSEFDRFLAELGYEREGNFYRVKSRNNNNIVMASHSGSSSAVLSHIFNMPFPFVCTAIRADFTGVTIVKFSGEDGSVISPEFEIMNDARHISHFSVENVFGN